jgi:hypothetical protein
MRRIRPRTTFDAARGETSQMLVAGRIGIISAARAVSSIGGGSNGRSSDTYRHSATYGRTTIDPGVADATVIDASATNASAATAAICQGVS